MKSIWKFPLELTDFQKIAMPKDAEILSVQVQGETPCLWALVDKEADKVSRGIWMHGTGHPIEHEEWHGRFIGSFQLKDGALVFHVFDYKQ